MVSDQRALSSALEKLSRNELIDLLLLPQDEQKTDKLRSIKEQLVVLHNSTEKKNNGLDYFVGIYMAYSIFHGYLKLVIPPTGTTEPHLQELMENYEANNKIKFGCYKLFLLIPQSTYCPTSLAECSKRIQEAGCLDEKLITRAAVQKRSYKNSVYKIKDEKRNSFTYVVAEYATTVQTYREVITYNYGEDSDAFKRNKDKVVRTFYVTLKKILQEHKNCTNFCELIYYNDDKDEESKNIADILLEEIEKLKQNDKI